MFIRSPPYFSAGALRRVAGRAGLLEDSIGGGDRASRINGRTGPSRQGDGWGQGEKADPPSPTRRRLHATRAYLLRDRRNSRACAIGYVDCRRERPSLLGGIKGLPHRASGDDGLELGPVPRCGARLGQGGPGYSQSRLGQARAGRHREMSRLAEDGASEPPESLEPRAGRAAGIMSPEVRPCARTRGRERKPIQYRDDIGFSRSRPCRALWFR